MTSISADEIDRHWHLDKKVPIVLVLTIIVQTLAIGIWVGTLAERVAQLEDKAIAAIDKGERLIRVEQDVVHVRKSLDRIEQKLDRNYPQ